MDILSLHVALVSSNTIKACNELATFKYSFIASEKGAKPHYDHHYHIGQMLADLHLYKTTLKRLNVITQISPCRQRCVHLSSLAAFTVLETLTIDQISLTPHESTCSVFQAQGNLPQNQLEVNLRVSPSLWTLTLHGCNDETITRSLGGVHIEEPLLPDCSLEPLKTAKCSYYYLEICLIAPDQAIFDLSYVPHHFKTPSDPIP
ncbi:hypothetical protein SLS61_002394 [Didymella pomorum]